MAHLQNLSWQVRKVTGDQFIESTDSIGANIAEGYGRYHFMDKIKFYYNARGSHFEACKHWVDLMHERGQIEDKDYDEYVTVANNLLAKLNKFIGSHYDSLHNSKKLKRN